MFRKDGMMSTGPFRVGISGSYGGLNFGDEAIVRQLRASVPVEITVFTRDVEDTLQRHHVEHAVVDATGDGDIAVPAGASFEIGRQEDGLVQPVTLMFRMGQFQYEAFRRYTQEHPDQWRSVYGLWDLVGQAYEDQ